MSSLRRFPGLQRLLKQVAAAMGYELVVYPGPSESLDAHLYRLFRRLQINTVLDVGANCGQYGASLREMGYHDRIISFEPVPEQCHRLQARASQDPLWDVHCLALGATDGVQEMNIFGIDPLFNSFLSPGEFMLEKGLAVDQVEQVSVRRLDSLFSEIAADVAEPRVYLKVDTQGYDLQVFRGATQTLESVLALQTELAVHPIYENAPTYLETLAFLNESGFDLTGFFPVSRDSALRVVEFDGVFVRRTAVGPLGHLQAP